MSRRSGKGAGLMSGRFFGRDEVRAARANRFATMLGDALYELGLTHQDVAQALGVPRYTVDAWTRGADSTIPREATLARLCALLDQYKPGLGRSLAAAVGQTWTPPAAPALGETASAPAPRAGPPP